MTAAASRASTLAVVALLAGAAAIGTSALFVKVSEVGPVSSAFWRVFLALPVLWCWAKLEKSASGRINAARPGPESAHPAPNSPHTAMSGNHPGSSSWRTPGPMLKPVADENGFRMASAADASGTTSTVSDVTAKVDVNATDPRLLMVLAGVFFAGDLAVWHWSIVLTSVANATLLANCAPIFVALAAWLLFRRKPNGLFVTGLAIAIAGMALLLRGDFQHAGTALIGDALGIVTAMFYAAYQLTVTRVRQAVSTARLMAISGAVTAAILLPIALLSEDRFMPASAQGWLILLGLALIAQAAGQSLIAYAMAHLPATFSSVGLLLQPVIAATLAWLLLGEALTVLAIGGGVLVLIGIRIAHAAESAPGRRHSS